jgi:hypothetical protein
MKIAAVTMVYNEALILPYFLSFYKYLDEIHVIYETDSTDNTLQILKNAPNVIVKNAHIKTGNDAIDKTDLINQVFYGIKADWVYVLDPDEFIFPPNENPFDFLGRQNYDVVRAALFQVYRHSTDKDLDPVLPIIGQRIHGDPDVFSTAIRAHRDFNAHYIKPIVVRPSKAIRFTPGKHSLEGNVNISSEFYIGAHWTMADQSIARCRRMNIKRRQSERQKAMGMGWQHTDVTEDWIKAECDRHLDDPVIPELIPLEKKTSEEIKTAFNKVFIQEALIVELKNQLKDRDCRLKETELQLKQITGSTTWKIVRKLLGAADKIIPSKFRRLFLTKHIQKNNSSPSTRIET